MTEQIRINDAVTVGGQPSIEELRELSDNGFRSVINLRTHNEEDQELTPDEEEEIVRGIGMEYAHIPVTADSLSQGKVEAFRERLNGLPSPVFVHCSSGKRAGAFTMMDVGVKQDMSGEQAIEKAEEMGFECDVPELEKFVKRYIDQH